MSSFQSGGSVNICEVTPEVKEALKKFRFRKTQDTAALICMYSESQPIRFKDIFSQ